MVPTSQQSVDPGRYEGIQIKDLQVGTIIEPTEQVNDFGGYAEKAFVHESTRSISATLKRSWCASTIPVLSSTTKPQSPPPAACNDADVVNIRFAAR